MERNHDNKLGHEQSQVSMIRNRYGWWESDPHSMCFSTDVYCDWLVEPWGSP